MLCEKCQKNQAAVYFTKITNNQKETTNLCEQCAQEYGKVPFNKEPGFSINNLLAGLLDFEPIMQGKKPVMPQREIQCPNCGLTYHQFGEIGRLGCGECYEAFAQRLDPLLRRIHGDVYHKGKIPRRIGGAVAIKKEIQQLKENMQQYILREEFEEAAKIRDRIRELEEAVQKRV